MKPWTDEIRQQIELWSGRLGNLHWWPRYVYHFTDVRNAVQILRHGYLYSRAEANRLGLMETDNASPDVIQQTSATHFQFARLYFRPRTPTQYANEGIRPRSQRELGGAHCPMPVFFCFDALTVLAQDETFFSDGNMGSARSTFSNTRDFFLRIPFDLVYHNRRFAPQERNEIIYHRHAEVLVPERLALEPALRFIACRSVAERQTLLNLLPVGLANRWNSRIRLGISELFERRWTYVEEVVVIDDRITFRFNPNTMTPGPFEVTFSYQEEWTDSPRTWTGRKERLDRPLNFRFEKTAHRWGTATLHLDDSLAFQGLLLFENIPF